MLTNVGRAPLAGPPYVGVLVANKVDLVDRRVVSKEEGMAFAASKELQYFECSAVSLWIRACVRNLSTLYPTEGRKKYGQPIQISCRNVL